MRDALWTKTELEAWADGLGAAIRGALPESISGISIDSRSLARGEVFFAIKGDRFDGHNYAAQAAEAGAALLVIDRAHEKLAESINTPRLIVSDVMEALRALARAARARLKPQARVLAVTGSVGKTTVKEMLAQIFGQFGRIHKNPASFNNHWGVPLTLARMPRDADYAIFEIGMNHAGEIAPLAKLVRPHLALITKIAAVHMEYFKSLEEIAAAKAEIFSGVEPNGIAVLPRDDEFYEFLAEKAYEAGIHQTVSFGEVHYADYSLNILNNANELEYCFDGHHKKHKKLVLAAHGIHMLLNASAALAAAGELAIKPIADETVRVDRWRRAFEILAQFYAVEGRGARYRLALPNGGSFTLIDESYNANLTSMKAALAILGQEQGGRHIAVLGDMLELGANTKQEHKFLTSPIVQACNRRGDIVFLIGAEMKANAFPYLTNPHNKNSGLECYSYENAQGAIEPLMRILRDGDCVMVKSSHSIQTEQIVKKLLADYRGLPQAH